MPERLHFTVTPIDATPAVELFSQATEPLVWWRRGQGLVAWGQAARAEFNGPNRFDLAEAWWREVVAHSRVIGHPMNWAVAPICLGTFTFAATSPLPSVLVVPEVALYQQGNQRWLIKAEPLATGGLRLPSQDPGKLFAQPFANPAPGPPPASPKTGHQPRPPTGPRGKAEGKALGQGSGIAERSGHHRASAWPGVIQQALTAINRGEVEKVVLARDVLVAAEPPIDLRQVVSALMREYPDCWTYSVEGLVGATPELLVRLRGGLVTSRVLAGTIRRTGDDAADLARAGALARSSKDLEEHQFAVESVIAALEPFVEALSWPEVPSVLHLPNVMHLATDVVGDLTGRDRGAMPWSVALAKALHPTAAVCGTPRLNAARLIAQLEGIDRGRYAGPVGWMDATGQGEWGIALRCGQFNAPRDLAQLWAGGGIVAASVPAEELAETEAKLQPMRQALTLASG